MDNKLVEAAVGARAYAHAPYSRFAVGAAIRTADGAIHVGCNVENAAFPEGWCAETSAIAGMINSAQQGPGREIKMVCVVADKIDGKLVTPCGGCRQRLAEFGHHNTIVYAVAPDGEQKVYRLGELLPDAFYLDGER
ncbi:MAG: cytidine deaminase [Alphaproteobacteria bacterium]